MQSKEYLVLPHQFKEWQAERKCLEAITKEEDLEKMITFLNNINEKYTWSIKTFQKLDVVKLLQYAAECALQVQKLFPDGIKISYPLKQEGMSLTILTKRQALCLVCNMFFGTTRAQPDKTSLPVYYDFSRLSRHPNEIIKAMFNYFDRTKKQSDSDHVNIAYIRIAQSPQLQVFSSSQKPLCSVNFNNQGFIEDKKKAIQIDFANKSIGGFFLSETFTQQDIIFVNNPELMPALLFHKYMTDNECILMVGAQRFSKYTGYLDTYEFAGNFTDDRKIIELNLAGRSVKVKDSWISAIDAIPYFISSEFSSKNLLRELVKAFVGFNVMKLDGGQKVVSTGNWGSGAFNGNLEYKFLIQWLSASQADRNIEYFAFDNPKATLIPEVVEKCKGLTVGRLTSLLLKLETKFQDSRHVFQTILKTTF